MNVLVLGGGGFLGSHMVERLLQEGHRVTVFDRQPLCELPRLRQAQPAVRSVAADFRDSEALKAVLRGQQVVYHFIWAGSPAASWGRPEKEVEDNLGASLNLLQLAAEMGIRKLVFPSSGGTIYGPQAGAITEGVLPRPVNPHGIMKLTVEHLLGYYRQARGLGADIYRIGNAYGPRQPADRPQGVVAAWVYRIIHSQPIHVYGDAETLRDYVHVQDVSELMMWSLTCFPKIN